MSTEVKRFPPLYKWYQAIQMMLDGYVMISEEQPDLHQAIINGTFMIRKMNRTEPQWEQAFSNRGDLSITQDELNCNWFLLDDLYQWKEVSLEYAWEWLSKPFMDIMDVQHQDNKMIRCIPSGDHPGLTKEIERFYTAEVFKEDLSIPYAEISGKWFIKVPVNA